MNRKLFTRKNIRIKAKALRRDGKKIVFTNGTFDFLHRGHVSYLSQAKALGDYLIVGLNTDQSVRNYKGPGRPVNRQQDRAAVLAALEAVDAVVFFSAPNPLSLILDTKPHILVKGADWKVRDIAGAGEVRSWGGTVRRIRVVKGRSTTDFIRRLSRAVCEDEKHTS